MQCPSARPFGVGHLHSVHVDALVAGPSLRLEVARRSLLKDMPNRRVAFRLFVFTDPLEGA